ncbi:hypothetical protein NGA_0094900, partial [Nannochloropsis gaditana CCMP526]|uniref:uncharacterized protein n=1 Tax=Nannochloropsis gaditana (strain CCMP526) TaxID=1093141 RepID=UPI00029F6A0B
MFADLDEAHSAPLAFLSPPHPASPLPQSPPSSRPALPPGLRLLQHLRQSFADVGVVVMEKGPEK